MQVLLSNHDELAAQRVRVALDPLCRELGRRNEQDQCRLQVAPGVVIFECFARDGTRAQIAVGVKPLAAACLSGPSTIKKYVDQMLRWAKAHQERARVLGATGIILPR